MNIHEYPLHIRPGNFTVTLLFHDLEAIKRMYEILTQMIIEIDEGPWFAKASRFTQESIQKEE